MHYPLPVSVWPGGSQKLGTIPWAFYFSWSSLRLGVCFLSSFENHFSQLTNADYFCIITFYFLHKCWLFLVIILLFISASSHRASVVSSGLSEKIFLKESFKKRIRYNKYGIFRKSLSFQKFCIFLVFKRYNNLFWLIELWKIR